MATTVHPTPRDSNFGDRGSRKPSQPVQADGPATPAPAPGIVGDLDAQVQTNQAIEAAVSAQQTAWSDAQAAVEKLLAANQTLSDLIAQQAKNQSQIASDSNTLLSQIQSDARGLADSLNGVGQPAQ